jgi:FkbM family methyltransferase
MKIKPSDSTLWNLQNGDNTYRINYDLNSKSIVVDIGARHGNWSDLIKAKYNPQIYCFEVVNVFCKQLKEKGYNVFNKAVIDKTGIINLGIFESEASILYNENDTNEIITVESIPASQIFELIGSEIIDLMKINVEGAEYVILDNLIKSNSILKIKSIQIQFHLTNNSDALYKNIISQLEKTHRMTWRFPFVWENWEIK